MQEIKCRMWDTILNCYYESSIDSCVDKKGIYTFGTGNRFIADLFTGKQDKNGKDIYAGDILRDSTGICLVSWNDNFASFCLQRNGWAFDHFFGEAVESEDTEIIGNVHQNPGLLEGKC